MLFAKKGCDPPSPGNLGCGVSGEIVRGVFFGGSNSANYKVRNQASFAVPKPYASRLAGLRVRQRPALLGRLNRMLVDRLREPPVEVGEIRISE